MGIVAAQLHDTPALDDWGRAEEDSEYAEWWSESLLFKATQEAAAEEERRNRPAYQDDDTVIADVALTEDYICTDCKHVYTVDFCDEGTYEDITTCPECRSINSVSLDEWREAYGDST